MYNDDFLYVLVFGLNLYKINDTIAIIRQLKRKHNIVIILFADNNVKRVWVSSHSPCVSFNLSHFFSAYFAKLSLFAFDSPDSKVSILYSLLFLYFGFKTNVHLFSFSFCLFVFMFLFLYFKTSQFIVSIFT